MKRLIFILLCSLTVSCEVDPQDSGSPELLQSVSGVVLDGYVSNATVYVDSNDNHKVDAWEAKTTTDENGAFTLEFADTQGSVNLRAIGGYDQVTGRPFRGALSTSISGGGNVVISPLTSVMVGMSGTQQTGLATNLGVTVAEMEADYLDFSDTSLDANRAVLVQTALGTHKIAEILTQVLDANYTDYGSHADLPGSTGGMVYEQLGLFLQNNALDLGGFCDGGAANLATWIGNSEIAVRALMTEKLIALPAALGTADKTAMANQGDALCGAINAVAIDATSTPKLHRASQVVSMKMQANPQDASVTDAIGIMAPAVTTYIPNFTDDMDLTLVSDNITASVAAPYDTTDGTAALTGASLYPFPALGGKQFDGATVNASTITGDVGAVVLFFHGDAAATSGDLTMCIAYTQQNGTGTSNNTTGTRLTGSWTRLNDYNVVLDISILLFSESFLLRSTAQGAGTPRTFYLDFNDNIASWESTANIPNDFVTFVSAPANDTECVGVLP